MSNEELRIEDGDIMVTDGPSYRTATVALAAWSEGTVAYPSSRPRLRWWLERGAHHYRPIKDDETIPPFTPTEP